MFKTVNFNVFKENFQAIVYENFKKRSEADKKMSENEADAAAFDIPIPQPVPDFWRPDFISKFINYKPMKSK